LDGIVCLQAKINSPAMFLIDNARSYKRYLKLEPMLQVYYKTPTHLVVNGVFPTPEGICIASENGTIWRPIQPHPIKPLFKYPAYQHRGEFVGAGPAATPAASQK
jgi:hypothetical protein